MIPPPAWARHPGLPCVSTGASRWATKDYMSSYHGGSLRPASIDSRRDRQVDGIIPPPVCRPQAGLREAHTVATGYDRQGRFASGRPKQVGG